MSHRMPRPAALALAICALALLLAPAAHAKELVDYFGTDPAKVFGEKGGEFHLPGAIAVNQSGAGPAEAGDIYVVERSAPVGQHHRIQRFHRDTKGTPDPYDDTYDFVSAWGADVVQSGGSGDLGDATAADYEICTLAAQCKAGVPSAGNGTAAGNGTFDFGTSSDPGIAVDQDTGQVYVADAGNNRINVYTGDGAFLLSLGFDVDAATP